MHRRAMRKVGKAPCTGCARRDCIEKGNKPIRLITRTVAITVADAAMAGPVQRFVSLAVSQVGFMARQRGKIPAVEVQWKRGNPEKARRGEGEKSRCRAITFFRFPVYDQ